MQGLDEQMQELLIRYLDLEVNDEEMAKVEQWLSHPANLAYFEGLKQLYMRVPHTQSATPANVNVDAAWQMVASKTTESVGGTSPLKVVKGNAVWSFWLKIAAVLVIGTSIFWWVVNNNDSHQTATLKTMKTENNTLLVSLPDGSRVTLNAHSSLTYPEVFEGGKRNVQLKGEAFFDIERDTTQPFIISAGNANIQVLGTSFLVRDSKDSGVSVLVKTGKVKLYSAKNHNAAVVLVKGEQGFLARTGKLPVKQTIENINYLSQYDKVLRFENTPLNLVLKDLEKQYGVVFNVQQSTIEGCKITAKFEESSLDDILETLKIYFTWNIQQNGNTVTIKGKGCK